MKLTKKDFFDKYGNNDLISIKFHQDNINIAIKDSWDLNQEIQKMVGTSDNCHFISLSYTVMEIRIE